MTKSKSSEEKPSRGRCSRFPCIIASDFCYFQRNQLLNIDLFCINERCNVSCSWLKRNRALYLSALASRWKKKSNRWVSRIPLRNILEFLCNFWRHLILSLSLSYFNQSAFDAWFLQVRYRFCICIRYRLGRCLTFVSNRPMNYFSYRVQERCARKLDLSTFPREIVSTKTQDETFLASRRRDNYRMSRCGTRRCNWNVMSIVAIFNYWFSLIQC